MIVELLMLPLSIKQQKNSIKQAKLRPKEMAIRKKYAGRNDQATQQKITMEIQDFRSLPCSPASRNREGSVPPIRPINISVEYVLNPP